MEIQYGDVTLIVDDFSTTDGTSTTRDDLSKQHLVYFYRVNGIRYSGVSTDTVRQVTLGDTVFYEETQPGNNQEFTLDIPVSPADIEIYYAWTVVGGTNAQGELQPKTDGTLVVHWTYFPQLHEFSLATLS